MMEFKLNKFLSNYFTATAILPSETKEEIFTALAKAYDIDRPKALFKLCESEQVKDIDSVNKFFVYMRLKSLSALLGEVNEKLDRIITAKGQALVKVNELKLKSPEVLTSEDAISHLAECAGDGIVAAMCVYGFIRCEGICVPKNSDAGLKLLRKAANWYSVEACVLCLHYDPANAERYAELLYTVLPESNGDAIEEFVKNYGQNREKNKSVALLEKAFSRGIAKRDKIDHTVYRVLNAKGLSYADKKNALMSGAEFLAQVAVLPVNVEKLDLPRRELSLPFDRAEEKAILENVFATARFAASSKYRPLLVCGEERYLADGYIDAITKAYGDCNVRTIDVAAADERQLESGRPNIVVNGISEKKPNILLFVVRGDAGYEKSRTVAKFLNTEERRAFKLASSLTIDLSNVLPVVFCDKRNAGSFKNMCNVVYLAPMSKAEKKTAVRNLIEESSREFGSELAVDELTSDKIAELDIDATVSILTRLAMSSKREITYDDVKSCTDRERPVLGFRGE